MNMLEMLMQAQGGSAVGNLGRQFGLTEAQTQMAIRQLLPALSSGLKQNTATEGGLLDLLNALQRGNHERYIDDPGAIADSRTTEDGNAILGHVFGSKDVSRAVADQVSANTGIGSTVLKQMLPVLASMVMGSLARNTRNPGMQSVIESVLGGAGGGYRSGNLDAGLGGLIGGILGSEDREQEITGTSILGSILDADGDGSVADDLLRLAGRVMR